MQIRYIFMAAQGIHISRVMQKTVTASNQYLTAGSGATLTSLFLVPRDISEGSTGNLTTSSEERQHACVDMSDHLC